MDLINITDNTLEQFIRLILGFTIIISIITILDLIEKKIKERNKRKREEREEKGNVNGKDKNWYIWMRIL